MVFHRYLHLILLQALYLAKIGGLSVLVSWIYNFEIQVKF